MQPQAPLRIGWIGCGVMGLSMCRHTITIGGHKIFVHSRTPAKCEPVIQLGATFCETPAALVAHNIDFIVSMVGFPKDTENVVYGPNGILDGIRQLTPSQKPPIFIDMSTGQPSLATRIAETFQSLGSFALDAPVSGGDIGAKNRKLTIFVGGDKSTFEALESSLFRLVTDVNTGGSIRRMGAAGCGHQTKMVNQILIATNMIGVCEALLYAQAVDLNVEEALQAVSGGAAASWSLSNLAPRMLQRNFEPGFFVSHFIKDMEIALDEAKRLDLKLPGLQLAHELYSNLQAKGHNNLGTQALLLELEDQNKHRHLD